MTGGRLDLLSGLAELRRTRQIHPTSGTTGRDGIMGEYSTSKQFHSEGITYEPILNSHVDTVAV